MAPSSLFNSRNKACSEPGRNDSAESRPAKATRTTDLSQAATRVRLKQVVAPPRLEIQGRQAFKLHASPRGAVAAQTKTVRCALRQ